MVVGGGLGQRQVRPKKNEDLVVKMKMDKKKIPRPFDKLGSLYISGRDIEECVDHHTLKISYKKMYYQMKI